MNARSALRAAAIAFSLVLARGPAVAQTPSPAAVAPQPSASVPGANEIYDRARAAAKARTLPPYLSYDTHATFERKGKIKAEHLRVVLRTADGKSYVTPVPDSPRDRIDTAPRVEDRPPYNLSPFNTFGLIERKPSEKPSIYDAPGTPAPAASEPAVIGSVTVTARAYDVTLLGTETLAGHEVYHLALHPVRDPEHRRLRELFIATDSYRLERSVIQAYGAAGPLHTHPLVTIDYAPAGGAQAVVRISVDVTLRALFFAYGGHGEYRAEHVETPATEPDWMFDAHLLADHERAAKSGAHI